MSSKQVLIVAVLVTVFAWSVVMAALGQVAACVTLLPSLGLLVQQVAQALTDLRSRPPSAATDTPPAVTGEEHTR